MRWPAALINSDEHQQAAQFDRLNLSWEECRREWRGYTIIVSELLAASTHHNVKEFVIDVRGAPTGIGQKLFCGPNSNLTRTMEMFEAVDLMRLDLAIQLEVVGFPISPSGDSHVVEKFWTKSYLK
jgi:hypothetical protein